MEAKITNYGGIIVALSVLGALIGRLVQSSVIVGVSCLFPVVLMILAIVRRRSVVPRPRVASSLEPGVRAGGAAQR